MAKYIYVLTIIVTDFAVFLNASQSHIIKQKSSLVDQGPASG